MKVESIKQAQRLERRLEQRRQRSHGADNGAFEEMYEEGGTGVDGAGEALPESGSEEADDQVYCYM